MLENAIQSLQKNLMTSSSKESLEGRLRKSYGLNVVLWLLSMLFGNKVGRRTTINTHFWGLENAHNFFEFSQILYTSWWFFQFLNWTWERRVLPALFSEYFSSSNIQLMQHSEHLLYPLTKFDYNNMQPANLLGDELEIPAAPVGRQGLESELISESMTRVGFETYHIWERLAWPRMFVVPSMSVEILGIRWRSNIPVNQSLSNDSSALQSQEWRTFECKSERRSELCLSAAIGKALFNNDIEVVPRMSLHRHVRGISIFSCPPHPWNFSLYIWRDHMYFYEIEYPQVFCFHHDTLLWRVS